MEIQQESNSQLSAQRNSNTDQPSQGPSCSTQRSTIGKSKGSKEPTEAELCEILRMMKDTMPERSLEKAIMMMFDYQIKKKPPEKVFCDYIPPVSHIPEAERGYKYSPKNREAIEIIYDKDEELKTNFSTEQEEVRYKQKRQIAKAYLKQGYSLHKAQLFVQKFRVINKDDYKLIMSSIISQSFRRLQKFLMQTCGFKIKNLNKTQMSNTITYILRNPPNSDYRFVFLKFIKLNFALTPVVINEIQAVHFYLEIIKFLHSKRLTLEGVQAYYNSQTFQQRSENGSATDTASISVSVKVCDNLAETYDDIVVKEITKTFLQTKNVKETAKILHGIYPTWATIDKIKDHLFVIAKNALKMIQQQASTQNESFSRLHILTDEEIYKIFHFKESQDIRISLLDYYVKNAFNEDDLFFLVEMINDFIETIRKDPGNDYQDDKSSVVDVKEQDDTIH